MNNANSFIVKIINTENENWQGTIEWIGQDKKVGFRSALEMLNIIQSAIKDEE